MCPRYFLKIAGKPNNYQFYLPNFLKFCDNISHKLLRPTKFLGKFWKFWNGLLCRNKSGSFPLLSVTVYWQSSNAKACAKKVSQILVNNMDNGGREIGLRIYVRYCRLGLLYKLKSMDISGELYNLIIYYLL